MAAEIKKDLLAQLFLPVDRPFVVNLENILLSYQTSRAEGNNHFSLRVSNVEIQARQVHCIYGTNGCGKTTLLRTLAGLQSPQDGFATWSPSKPRLGLDQVLVTQAGPMPHWTVGENVTLPMLNQGIEKQTATDRANILIQLLGLQGFENRYAHQLSAGQQQRTVLARALSISPKILLLDEIMSGQSEYWSARIAEILRFYAMTGRMVVIVSHDPEWVIACADRVTNIVSDTTDAVSTTQFFVGYDGRFKTGSRFENHDFASSMNKILGIDDFFYVSDRSYDLTAEKALPHYHDAHKLLVTCLPFPREAKIEVIDLGVGSGVTSAYVLKNFPNAHVTGVDLFPEMLAEARPRLKPFTDRVTLVQSDNTNFLTSAEAKADAIVSAFCIHHQDEQGKKDLFAAAKKLLKPGGVFLMLDWTIFNSPFLQKIARENTMRHLEAKVTDAAYREKWAYHWNYINIPSSADDMVEWMRALGFRAEIVFRDFEIALLSAAARCVTEKSSFERI